MKIGFLMPAMIGLSPKSNGVRMMAEYQAKALESLGHTVIRMTPWNTYEELGLDVLHFFIGGFGLQGIEHYRRYLSKSMIFGPVIDSNQSHFAYRMSAYAGRILGNRLLSVPSTFRSQALASDAVVVMSSHSKERLVVGLGVPESKVHVVLLGMDPNESGDGLAARKRHSLPEEFALHVGMYADPRKNCQRLIEAVGPLGVPLVIAGHPHPSASLDRIKAAAKPFPNVRFLGYLERQELIDLYAACRVFCLPSHHEGTGLVAVEAAAAGARILITKNGGPRDYFENYVEYVDPTSTEGIRAAFQRAWNVESTSDLQEHVRNKLTWERSARSLSAVYEQTLNDRLD
jgi:glycosyltransferase involved in cell wall biosynthesis